MSGTGQDAETAAGGEVAAEPVPDAPADDPAEAPYVFDPAHVAVGVAALDAAFTEVFAGAVG